KIPRLYPFRKSRIFSANLWLTTSFQNYASIQIVAGSSRFSYVNASLPITEHLICNILYAREKNSQKT
ncbi:hypothetical protein GBAR_LOCUS26011, partial [Geodia barretti]